MLVSFLQWWNLVFELPFFLALLYTVLETVGGLGSGDGGDADADHDVDFGHDVDVDHDVDVGHDVGHDFEHGFEHGIEHVVHDQQLVPAESHQGGELVRAFSFLGVGRIPLSLVMTTFLYIFGFAGWAGNMIMAGTLLPPEIYFWGSLLLAVVSAVFLTRTFAIQLGRLLPRYESFGISSVEELLGFTGEVTNRITDTFGTAHVRDSLGNLHEVHCRVRPGEKPIPHGTQVLLTEYDPQKEVFGVVEYKDPLE